MTYVDDLMIVVNVISGNVLINPLVIFRSESLPVEFVVTFCGPSLPWYISVDEIAHEHLSRKREKGKGKRGGGGSGAISMLAHVRHREKASKKQKRGMRDPPKIQYDQDQFYPPIPELL